MGWRTRLPLRRRRHAVPKVQCERRRDGATAAERLQNSIRQKGLASLKADKGWRRRFDDPIPLPRGRQLITLQDAGTYITKLPKAEHDAEEWQTAMEALLLVVEFGGPTMFARIGGTKRGTFTGPYQGNNPLWEPGPFAEGEEMTIIVSLRNDLHRLVGRRA
jgi:hypothetical protein